MTCQGSEQKRVCRTCGVEKEFSAFRKIKHLKDGISVHCTPCMRIIESERKRKNPELYKARRDREWTAQIRMYRGSKDRAKGLGIEFSIKPKDILIPDKCPLLEIPLQRGKGKFARNSPTIDRFDSTKGYVPGNVWVISHMANACKNNATPSELMRLATNLKKITNGEIDVTKMEPHKEYQAFVRSRKPSCLYCVPLRKDGFGIQPEGWRSYKNMHSLLEAWV